MTVRKSKEKAVKKAVAVEKAAAVEDFVNLAANQCLFNINMSLLLLTDFQMKCFEVVLNYYF